jgi:CheY-like chemotaxis protein
MSGQVGQKTILWIENDTDLTKSMGRLLKAHLEPKGFRIEIARNIAKALVKLQGHLEKYVALIVDTMLPYDDDAMQEAERLERDRGKLLDEAYKAAQAPSPSNEEARAKQSEIKAQIRAKIIAIDQQLDELTDLEGGIYVLEQISAGGPKLKLLTIVLSARSLKGLKEHAEDLVEPGKFYWVAKPTTAESVISIIKEHCG